MRSGVKFRWMQCWLRVPVGCWPIYQSCFMIEKIASHQVTPIALRDWGCKLRQIMSGEKKPAIVRAIKCDKKVDLGGDSTILVGLYWPKNIIEYMNVHCMRSVMWGINNHLTWLCGFLNDLQFGWHDWTFCQWSTLSILQFFRRWRISALLGVPRVPLSRECMHASRH